MIFTEIESGISVEGNPIQAYKSNITDGKFFYLIAGVHGDEMEGVYVLKQLFDWLKTSKDSIKIPIIVIPVLNVDGYRDQNRVNSHGVDLNRNLPTHDWSPDCAKDRYFPGHEPLSEPENKFLLKLFEEYPPGFVISFHTWKPIVNYNGDAEAVAKFLAAYNQYPLQDDIGYSTPGSLGTYLSEVLNVPSITFECPELADKESLNEIWLENKVALLKLFSSEIVKCSL